MGCNDGSVEGDLGLPDVTLTAIKDQTFLGCCFYEWYKVSVVFFCVPAIDTYVIMYHFYSRDALGGLSVCIWNTICDILRPNGM